MKKASIITLLVAAALLLSVVPATADVFQGEHSRISPFFEPFLSAPTRGTVISAYTAQGYDTGWYNSYRLEASYNAQGSCAIVTQSTWIDSTGLYEPVMRLLYSYQTNGSPLRVDWQSPTAEGWSDSAYSLWLYSNDRLISIVTNEITTEGDLPYFREQFHYNQETGRLAIIVETYYMIDAESPYMNKYEYEWDSQGRQSAIQEYRLNAGDADWIRGYKNLISYRPEDSSTYTDHLRYLELGFPFVSGFASGLNPFLIADKTMLGFYPGDTPYVNQTSHYLYHADMRLDRIQIYFGDLDDTLYFENDYTYANGQINAETTSMLDFPSSEMLPNSRTLYEYTTIVENDDPVVPAQVTSLNVYPNPFNPSATISYSLREADNVRLDVFNLKGQKVRVLDEGIKTTGMHNVIWDGTDSSGNVLQSGIYFLRISSGNDVQTTKAVLTK